MCMQCLISASMGRRACRPAQALMTSPSANCPGPLRVAQEQRLAARTRVAGRSLLDAMGGSGRYASHPSRCPAPRRILLPPHTCTENRSDGSGSFAPEAATAYADTVESAGGKGLARFDSPQASSLPREPQALVSDARRSSCVQASSILPNVASRIGFLAMKTQSQPGSMRGMRKRTASRIRRFTLLRTTARPIRRLTENPKRL